MTRYLPPPPFPTRPPHRLDSRCPTISTPTPVSNLPDDTDPDDVLRKLLGTVGEDGGESVSSEPEDTEEGANS